MLGRISDGEHAGHCGSCVLGAEGIVEAGLEWILADKHARHSM